MRKSRVILLALAATAAISLLPAAGAQAATTPPAVCGASGALQIGLFGIKIPGSIGCTTAPLPCPAGLVCTYQTTAVVTNLLSISSGVSATTLGSGANGQPLASTTSCGGFQTCTAVSSLNVSGAGLGAGSCNWAPGPISLGAIVNISCKVEITAVSAVL